MSNPSPVTLTYIIQTDTVQNVFISDDNYNISNPIESTIKKSVARDQSGRGGVGWGGVSPNIDTRRNICQESRFNRHKFSDEKSARHNLTKYPVSQTINPWTIEVGDTGVRLSPLLLNIFHGNGSRAVRTCRGVGLPASVWSGAHWAMCPQHGLISHPRPASVISGGGLSCVSYCFNLSFTQFHKFGVTKLGKILSKARDMMGFKIYCHWYYWCTVTYHTTVLLLCGLQQGHTGAARSGSLCTF